jgi:hypothetical protein
VLLAEGEPAASALNSGYHLAYVIGAGLVLVAIAIAISVLRAPEPAAAAEPAAETPAAERVEPVEGKPLRVIPLPADVVPGGGCVETGIRVTIGCGGCAAESP